MGFGPYPLFNLIFLVKITPNHGFSNGRRTIIRSFKIFNLTAPGHQTLEVSSTFSLNGIHGDTQLVSPGTIMNRFGHSNLCHSVVPKPIKDLTGLLAKIAKMIRFSHSQVLKFTFFPINSKIKGFRASSYSQCTYKHAYCGQFKLKIKSLRPSEAEIQKSL